MGVFLDLRKAFDTVDHDILLRKLFAHGIRDNLLKWFKSYLTNRTQYVYINDNQSEIKKITHGVPQGSILGPLLFIIYMNDFSSESKLLFSILFADDTTVILEGKTYTKLIETLNTELNHIERWLNANKLTINVKKTQYMLFHRARIKSDGINIIINNNTIQCTKSTKFLGIIIDDKLKWTEHISHVRNTISKSIGILFRVRNYLDKKTLRNLYHTFVFPCLIYCNEVWGNAASVHLDPILKLQKKMCQGNNLLAIPCSY